MIKKRSLVIFLLAVGIAVFWIMSLPHPDLSQAPKYLKLQYSIFNIFEREKVISQQKMRFVTVGHSFLGPGRYGSKKSYYVKLVLENNSSIQVGSF